jgi:hypothetical protein
VPGGLTLDPPTVPQALTTATLALHNGHFGHLYRDSTAEALVTNRNAALLLSYPPPFGKTAVVAFPPSAPNGGVVVCGFPFEELSDTGAQAQFMRDALGFLGVKGNTQPARDIPKRPSRRPPGRR